MDPERKSFYRRDIVSISEQAHAHGTPHPLFYIF
jgi:hypothetical protein